LFSKKWSTRIGRRLAHAEQTMRVRIAREELRRLRELTLAINRLECEITELVAQIAPQLLAEPGLGPLIAAKLVGEIAGAQRFATSAKLARAAGVAPIPASSGSTQRQRLDQSGNRQINAALHRVIVTRARCHPPTRDYIERRRSEGKSTREAIRCLKRYLVRHVWRLLQPPLTTRTPPSPHSSLDIEATHASVSARLQETPAQDDVHEPRSTLLLPGATGGLRLPPQCAARCPVDGERERSSWAARLATDPGGEVAALLLPLVAHVVGRRRDPAIMRRREPAGNDVSNPPDNAPPLTVAVPDVW
jgi:hypothetical protein